MTINYDPKSTKGLSDGMELGSGIELPWLAPPVWVVNGDAKLRAMSSAAPALYFGGWCANADDVKAAGEEAGLPDVPAGFFETETTSRDNKPLKVLVSRFVYVAPFGIRKSWISKDKMRTAQYTPGSRQHVQVLAILAVKDSESGFTPLYPILLSAKGWQAQHLERSFSTWASKTANMRRKLAKSIGADDIPAWAFYAAVGTFGAEPKIELVGAGQNQSPITPIGVFLPKEITEATLEALFVDQQVIEWMITLKDEAKEWLGAWATIQASQATAQQAPPPVDDFYIPGGAPEDELPF